MELLLAEETLKSMILPDIPGITPDDWKLAKEFIGYTPDLFPADLEIEDGVH